MNSRFCSDSRPQLTRRLPSFSELGPIVLTAGQEFRPGSGLISWAELALSQVRVRLPTRFPRRVAGPSDHRYLVEILQRGASTFDPCRRQDADGGLRPSAGRCLILDRAGVDNFVEAQWTMLSTVEPGTPLVSRGPLHGKQQQPTGRTAALQTSMESTLTPLSAVQRMGSTSLGAGVPSAPTETETPN